MRFRLVRKSMTLDDLELLNFKFSRNFALVRNLDECCSECALTFALARFSCLIRGGSGRVHVYKTLANVLSCVQHLAN